MKKRIYFILADENLFHPYYFSGVLKNLPGSDYLPVGVTVSTRRSRRNFLKEIIQQYYLWGFIGFVFIALSSSLRSLLDKLSIGRFSVQSIAAANKIKYLQAEDVNSQQHLDNLKKLNVDIIISSNGQIFKKDLLNLPRIACINRHTALLPNYGGVLPVFWAMLFNEEKFGVSVHYMVEQVDQGDILYQEPINLDKRNSLFKNYVLGFNVSIRVTIKALENLSSGKIVKKFHPNKKQYFSYPKKLEITRFKKKYRNFNLSDIRYYLTHIGKVKV